MSNTQPPAETPQTIETVRSHLFATLEGLRDKVNPMAVDRARAISEVANTIVNTARVEIEFAKVSKRQVRAGFIPLAAPAAGDGTPPAGGRSGDLPKSSAVPPMPASGINSVTRHLLKDD